MFSRRPPPNVRLSGRERRVLRRLEDAAVADDPLLEVRLGLTMSRSKRAVVRLRRKSKTLGRYLSAQVPTLVVGLIWFVLVAVSIAASWSVVVPSLVSVPCAFTFGVAVGRRRRLTGSTSTGSSLASLVQDSS
jgi:hypothetical protein